MTTPLIVVVLIAMGDAQETSTRAMTATAQESLEPGAIVLVQEGATGSDADIAQLANTLRADAVAVVTWPQVDRTRAHLHVYGARQANWYDRDLTFNASDATVERGKALGFAIAAMVPPRPVETSPGEPSDARAAPAEVPLSSPASGPGRRIALDLVATGSAGIGGSGGGVGSDLTGRWRLLSAFSLCMGGGLRFGEIADAQASTTALRLKTGVAWRTLRTAGERPVTLGLRSDLLATLQFVSRTLSVGRESGGSRWMPGADLLVEGAWYFTPATAFVGAVGGEVAFGTTRVFVGDVERATIPNLRMVGEVGVRARF